jgi:energy-coupling factor transporter ATP-binding protein EcfA2
MVNINELVEHTENSVPIYAQILDKAAIELHKLIRLAGGTLLKVHTDCIYVLDPNEVPLSNEPGGYKEVDLTNGHKFVKHLQPKRQTTYQLLDSDWKNINELNDDGTKRDVLEDAKQLIKEGRSFSITGGPGCGKTYLLNQISDMMNDKGIRHQKLAPSNKAARLINGTTIHKFLKIGIHETVIPRKRMLHINKLSYIIIDEISMLSYKFYSLFSALKNITKIKFIMIGDFKQLLPIEENPRPGNYYKECAALKTLCDYNKINMMINKRSDDTMWNLIHNIAGVDYNKFPHKIAKINLCWRNVTRKEINDQCMNNMRRSNRDKPCLVMDKDEKDDYTQDLIIMKGTPVVSRTNKVNMGIINSQMFTVIDWDDKNIRMRNNDDENNIIKVAHSKFQKLFAVAYCTTIHKYQGTTINKPFTIHEWDLLDERLKYVALSRTTDIDLINIVK